MTERMVDFEEALAAFSKRFHPNTEREVIEAQFDSWWAHGALQFGRAANGELQVRLGPVRTRL